jgi:predicted enzyme related to lactoylglutathione lyase
MSDATPRPPVGTIGWTDLTVPDADGLRDFYAAVVGWGAEALSMGEYSDYVMTSPETGQAVAGVCHARGTNAGLPPVWLVYLSVADLDASLREVTARGGTVVMGPKGGGEAGRFAVIRDPAGAHCALHQAGK